MPLVDSEIEQFCYPTKQGYKTLGEIAYPHVKRYLGDYVLDLGCGTGWLRDCWKITNYIGVERCCFELPFQAKQQRQALRNGVLLQPVDAVLSNGVQHRFDTIVCFESFHAISRETLSLAQTPMLNDNGTLVIVDCVSWWPASPDFAAFGLTQDSTSPIPKSIFDFRSLASRTLDMVEEMENLGITRAAICSVARGNVQHEIYRGLAAGIPLTRLRTALAAQSFIPKNFDYRVIVLRKRFKRNYRSLASIVDA